MVMPRLLLFHVGVGDRGALVHVAHPVRKPAVEQHPLGDGGLSGIDVGNDADISEVFDVVGHGGGNSLSQRT